MDELYAAAAAFVWGTRVKYLLVKLFYIVFDAYNKPIPSHSIFSVKKNGERGIMEWMLNKFSHYLF